MYQALYRKWRSRTFDEIVGQCHITSVLKKQTAEDRVSHAYLFCGTRGTGKTSSAKILAKAVNCENPVEGNPCNECYCCRSIDNATATDVLEIDAASNNRVADVRELIDEVVYPPSILKKRVYIINEVHMLSDSAFNALLKTLEEPPEYVLFILATTELNQLPATIISRCMRFDFRRIEPDSLAALLKNVSEKENILIADDAILLISKLADGSARDALSLLDACSAGRDKNIAISFSDIQTQLGITNNDTIIYLFDAISNKNIAEALSLLSQVHKSSKDLNVFMIDLIAFVRDLLIAKSLPSSSEAYLKEQFFFSSLASEKISGLIKAFTTETLLYFSSVLEESLNSVSRFTVNKKTFFELTIIKLCDLTLSENPKALLARISDLEKRLSEGNLTPVVTQTPEKQAPKVEEPKIIPIPNPIIKSQQNEKPFAAFPEVLEELKEQVSIYPLVKMSRMYEKGNEVIIYTDKLGKMLLTQDSNKELIENAVKSTTGKAYNLIIKEKTSLDEVYPLPIDELNNI
ncbi:MAG TPA: DNA polymerase III subunit gamma/tau [Clostridiales bacterium]|nr:DNA polymerase III subunit gamma/tau [Clostridiales bacterium]